MHCEQASEAQSDGACERSRLEWDRDHVSMRSVQITAIVAATEGVGARRAKPFPRNATENSDQLGSPVAMSTGS
jgi:hypothetical protein